MSKIAQSNTFIRVKLASSSVRPLEKACQGIVENAKKRQVSTRGPIRMPTKKMSISTLKTPCGEGRKTWHRFDMGIHKRVVDILAGTDEARSITNVPLDPSIILEVSVIKPSNE
ncbi:hypothetical protein PCE1_002052 [Barthelona sp. PCE]